MCFSTGDYTTNHTTTIPSGYSALWTQENGGPWGTFNTNTNGANVGITWFGGFGYLGLTLTNSNGCGFKSIVTVKDQCACNCLNSRTYNYTKSNLVVTFTAGNTNSSCPQNTSSLRFNWGDGIINYLPVHTYALAGTYTVTITPVIRGGYDEPICSGPIYTTTVTVTGGTKKQSFGNQIIISPNPASFVLNYNVSGLKSGLLETVIRTIDGKELLRKKWNLPIGNQELQLELPNNISNGIIFVDLISDEVKETRSIIIKK
jgi:PKD repeat protein